jgi:hypothetical protein
MESQRDELCTCGHKRSEHEMSHAAKYYGSGLSEETAKILGLHGHGACTQCSCYKFTWKAFVDKDGNIVD